MNQTSNRLYDLLPVIYRLRDADQNYALRGLLQVMSEQADAIEADISQLYENWFIETAQDWIVPYIGELVGYDPVHEAGQPGASGTGRDLARQKILIPRREVANTLRYRRSKGTLYLLELLAESVASWPARAVEFQRLLGRTQYLDHLYLGRGCWVGLRNNIALRDLADDNGAFDRLAHTVDVRQISEVFPRSRGRYNIPSVGLFIWRLGAYAIDRAPAFCRDNAPSTFTFSVLGNDTPLYHAAGPEPAPTHIAGELNLPTRITRQELEEPVWINGQLDHIEASPNYYGPGQSMAVYVTETTRGPERLVPASSIIPADLSGWKYDPPAGHIAIDPELGRLAFPSKGRQPKGVRVYYHYAFSADMGGGTYDRPLTQPGEFTLYRVGAGQAYPDLKGAFAAWEKDKQAHQDADTGAVPPAFRNAVIEIADSRAYTEPINVNLRALESLQVRAANGQRPTIRLLDYTPDQPDPFTVAGEAGSRFTLDGLLVTGRGLVVMPPEPSEPPANKKVRQKRPPPSDLCKITIRHCTLVPGWSLDYDCTPRHPDNPSLLLSGTRAKVEIEHSILGPIVVEADEVRSEPLSLTLTDSILDSTDSGKPGLSAGELPMAYVSLHIERATVIGQVYAHSIEVAEDCIFLSDVVVARRQVGCVRFSFVPPDSRTPRRYHCQPDLSDQAVHERVTSGRLNPSQEDTLRQDERQRIFPLFNSLRYGNPAYCQLSLACAAEICQGASDESEMGAFHDLYQPQREANLRARLDEYTPSGKSVGILFVS